MKRIPFFILLVFSVINLWAQSDSTIAQIHYKDAEHYAGESKKHYLIAGVCLVFVIVVRLLNKYINKEEPGDSGKTGA